MNSKLVLAAAALLAGCATTTMDSIMQSWHGEHIDAVVKRWGYPNAERDFRGRKLYVWNDSGTYIVPSFGSATTTISRGQATTTGTAIGGGTVSGQCERVLEVDQAGKVIASQWGGNNCCVMAIAGHCAQLQNPARP